MLASQLIYTGCGKDKTGAFSVWSKTLDITKAEETEISEKMRYKRPPNTPFDPTKEELETLFPKKIGYFRLSSGRVCLAQSTYVSDVYSDLDQRTGNYVLHAFVFDSDETLIPMNFIGSDLFKRELTSEEWHADAPAELPRVEISERPSSLTGQEVDAFFDAQRIESLKLLLQAVINASADDRKITFYDAHENLKYWYKAISVCLPAELLKTLTFNTLFMPSVQLPSQMGVPAVNTEIKIRNIMPAMVTSTIFNYREEARAGKYAFDFSAGILPTGIEISAYVDTVVDTLLTNVFGAIMFVDTVGKISAKCGVDLNVAADLQCLLSNQIGRVDDVAKLKQLIGYVKKFYPEELSDVADHLYAYGLQSGLWRLSREISDVYRFIFDTSANANRAWMIEQYVVNREAFGVNSNADCDAYVASFREHAPFAWEHFAEYLLESVASGAYVRMSGDSFNSRYLAFDAFVEALPTVAKDPEKKTVVLRYFVENAKACIQKERMDGLSQFVKCIARAGGKWVSWLLEKSYAVLCANGVRLSDAVSPDFTLRVAEAYADTPVARELVSRLIGENERDNAFIKLYVAHYDQNTSFYSAVARDLKTDAKYAAFLENVELYRFMTASTVKKEDLQWYYNNYFSKGRDKGFFEKKLKQYLSAFAGKDLVNESLRCFDLWIRDQQAEGDGTSACAELICDAFFSADPQILREYISFKGTEKIKELLASAPENYRAPNHYYVIAFGESLKALVEELASKKKPALAKDVTEKLGEDSFYRLPKDEQVRELFLKFYLTDVFRLYFLLATEENFADVYCQLFQPFYTCMSFSRLFRDTLEKLGEKDYDLFLGDTVICACSKSGKFNDYLLPIVEDILDGIARGKRKKLFAQILESVPAAYEKRTRAFVEQYQKEHEGFFEKMFGGHAKREEKEQKLPKKNKGDDVRDTDVARKNESEKKKWKK